MFIYDTKAQRQLIREHVDHLAQDMGRTPDKTASGISPTRWTGRLTALLQLRTRRVRRARLRAHAYDG
jgi:hypothetical protein